MPRNRNNSTGNHSGAAVPRGPLCWKPSPTAIGSAKCAHHQQTHQSRDRGKRRCHKSFRGARRAYFGVPEQSFTRRAERPDIWHAMFEGLALTNDASASWAISTPKIDRSSNRQRLSSPAWRSRPLTCHRCSRFKPGQLNSASSTFRDLQRLRCVHHR